MTDEQTQKLKQLATFLTTAKHEEKLARDKRVEIEEEIVALVEGPERGQRTVDIDGIKITVERGFNYQTDFDAMLGALEGTAKPYYAPIKSKTTRELDVTGYEWYRSNDPETFRIISQFVTAKPKKPAVTVKGL